MPLFGGNSQKLAWRIALYVLFSATLCTILGCAEPLIVAVREGDNNTVRTLLDQGVDINVRDDFLLNNPQSQFGECRIMEGTVLHHAAMMGNLDTVRLLLDRGADINAKAKLPYVRIFQTPIIVTPLTLATTGRFAYGYFVGCLPSNATFTGGNVDVVKLLLANGAIVDDVALNYARVSGQSTIRQLLEQAAAAQRAGTQVASAPDVTKKSQPTDIDALIRQEGDAQLKGDYTAALYALRRAFSAVPDNARVYQRAGELLISMCDSEGARVLIEEGLKHNLNDRDLQQLLGTIKGQKSGNVGTSDKPVCRAQTLNQEGVALAREQKPDMALAKFEEAIRIAPYLAKAHYNAALILEQTGRPREALSHYVTAQQFFLLTEEEIENLARMVALVQRTGIAPSEAADEHYRVGIVRAQQKRFAEAIQEFEAAIAAAPWMVDAYYNLGLVYDFTATYSDALRNFSIYAQLAPTAPNIGTVKTKIVELKDRLGMLKR